MATRATINNSPSWMHQGGEALGHSSIPVRRCVQAPVFTSTAAPPQGRRRKPLSLLAGTKDPSLGLSKKEEEAVTDRKRAGRSLLVRGSGWSRYRSIRSDDRRPAPRPSGRRGSRARLKAQKVPAARLTRRTRSSRRASAHRRPDNQRAVSECGKIT